MPHFVLAGFDKWCRIKSGLSNAKIAAALSTPQKSYSEEEILGWRAGQAIPDPPATLLPLRVALSTPAGPWPPATAEEAWQELLMVIEGGVPASEAPTPKEIVVPQPTRATPPRPKASSAPVQTDPVLDATKADLESALEQLSQAVTAAEQVQGGWFTRTTDKLKKYSSARDMKHRKAFFKYCVQRAEASLDKAQSRRSDLSAGLEAVGQALSTFEKMQQENAERMERKRDENVALWRELKAAVPQFATARQTYDKAKNKTLASLDEVIKRGRGLMADWQTKHDAIGDPAAVTLAWLTRDSKLGQRLQNVWQQRKIQKGGDWVWPDDFDPFEGACICKDKLADNYKVGLSHKAEKPVEIDLSAEIDLTMVGLERRQQAARLE